MLWLGTLKSVVFLGCITVFFIIAHLVLDITWAMSDTIYSAFLFSISFFTVLFFVSASRFMDSFVKREKREGDNLQ